MKLLSFILPCYRSEYTVGDVIQEIITTVTQNENYDYEIIAVNDCSPDNVLSVLRHLAKESSKIKVIDLAKNMGKNSALMAGYSFAEGEIIINLDDDGQCPVDQLWNLIEPIENGYDVSIARYRQKKQSWFKNFGSKINHLMACFLIGKPKELQISNFTAMKRFVCTEILRYKNPYPYISGLFLRATSWVKNVDMEERERIIGSSGYTFSKSLKMLLNGLTAFSVRPLRLATILGFFTALIGFCYALFVIIKKIIDTTMLAGYSSLMAVQLLIGGVIMMLLGLIGEYVGRIYISMNNSPQYVIRETVNINKTVGVVENLEI